MTASLRIAAFCVAVAPMEVAAELSGANPVRKVVTMLQSMKAKVEAEGKKQQELFDKYMCYCKSGGSDLAAAIKAANIKTPAVASDIKESEAQLAQTKSDLKQAQNDRSAAKQAIAQAQALRDKEAAAFAEQKSELETTIAAIKKALAALEKGVGASFVQSGDADVLRKFALDKGDMVGSDRDGLLAFLSGSQSSGYTPSSGEVIGILKEMADTMADSLTKAVSAEESAIGNFEQLVSDKTKEVDLLTGTIETKMTRIGDFGVAIVQMKNDLSDTEASLIEDQKFLAELQTTCKTKEAEWAGIVQNRADELVALSETITILNDDASLELFKKTLPSAASNLLQVSRSMSVMRRRALDILAGVRQTGAVHIDLIALALHGKTADFTKVIALIDNMVKLLKKEQLDDDHRKEYCEMSLDKADDKKKGVERSVSDAETAIAAAEEGITTVTEEIAALEKGIKDLDKSVVEATEQRQEEHSDFNNLMAADTAAKELLKFAKNRLNKFYNKDLYKAPPKRELSAEDRVVVNMGGTLAPTAAPGGIAGTGIAVLAQVGQHSQRRDAQPEAPSAYAKKSEESGGVIAMIDLLIKDLDKELTESQTAEKSAQSDYEKLTRDSAEKRATDSNALTDKISTKAALEAELEAQKEAKMSSTKELMATLEYIQSLHAECDWLVQNFDVRKEARSGEVEALDRARDVLNGADYSFVQRDTRTLLARPQ